MLRCLLSLIEGHNRLTFNIDEETSAIIGKEIECFKQCVEEKRLLSLNFTTVDEYLSLLETVGKELCIRNSKVVFFLAAAVSDFYIPKEKV